MPVTSMAVVWVNLKHFLHEKSDAESVHIFLIILFDAECYGRHFLQNFGCSIAEAQLTGALVDSMGMPTEAAVLLEQFDVIFTVIFTAELMVNMLCNLWTQFVNDNWCALFLFIAFRIFRYLYTSPSHY